MCLRFGRRLVGKRISPIPWPRAPMFNCFSREKPFPSQSSRGPTLVFVLPPRSAPGGGPGGSRPAPSTHATGPSHSRGVNLTREALP
ncbi:hypothetical protein JTE90_018329 [Oedothorax gibbosus]|uniref:Uncharacterized protein n=1 Tax=Oedothorax gibbosus TaxID=931172 RepID=A0AAV6THE4_9ARAC|nr:hypothetical protein JTE90_018329 [Oedothorax gibbosus]